MYSFAHSYKNGKKNPSHLKALQEYDLENRIITDYYILQGDTSVKTHLPPFWKGIYSKWKEFDSFPLM